MAMKPSQTRLDLLRRLYQEFGGRCAYCGIKRGIDEIAIDHFYPRAQYPELEHDQLNLLPACDVCNVRKGARFPTEADGRPLLLHPRFSRYEEHIRFNDDGSASPLTPNGEVTISICDLNRPQLLAERRDAGQTSGSPAVMAIAELAEGHTVETLAAAMLDRMRQDGQARKSAAISEVLATIGIIGKHARLRQREQGKGKSRADRYLPGRRFYHVVEFDDIQSDDYTASMLISALILRLRESGNDEAATNLVRQFEPREFRVGNRTDLHNAAACENAAGVSSEADATIQPLHSPQVTDNLDVVKDKAVAMPNEASQAVDPLLRLKRAREKLREHPDKTCPKCSKATLTFEDRHEEELDRVTRTWKCNSHTYSSSAVGIPIAEWPSSMRSKWEAKAALLRANKQIIRCPDCGNESIEADESGVERIGTSQHIRLSCKISGCTFQKRETPRSIAGTLKANARSAIIFVIVAVGLLVLNHLLRTAANPPSISYPTASSQSPTSIDSGPVPASSSGPSEAVSVRPSITAPVLSPSSQPVDCAKATLPELVIGAAQIDVGEFDKIASATFESTRLKKLLFPEPNHHSWVNAVKVVERNPKPGSTKIVVAVMNVRPSNEQAFCTWLKCQGWKTCQLASK